MRGWRTVLLAGLALGSAGCAVLTVDVDVYKGPLINEREVQVEQLTQLVLASEPILVALRDQLEWPDDELQVYRGIDWYRPYYVTALPPPEPGTRKPFLEPSRSRFTNPLARAVNDDMLRGFLKAQAAIEGYRDGMEYARTGQAPTRVRRDTDPIACAKTWMEQFVRRNSEGTQEFVGLEEGEALHALLHELTRFASNLLVHANENALASRSHDGFVQDLGKRMYVGLWGKSGEGRSKHDFARVLQGIGNSVVTHVDALEKELAHRSRGSAERAALLEHFNDAGLIDKNDVPADSDPKEVADLLEASLRYELAAAERGDNRGIVLQKVLSDAKDALTAAENRLAAAKKAEGEFPPGPPPSDKTWVQWLEQVLANRRTALDAARTAVEDAKDDKGRAAAKKAEAVALRAFESAEADLKKRKTLEGAVTKASAAIPEKQKRVELAKDALAAFRTDGNPKGGAENVARIQAALDRVDEFRRNNSFLLPASSYLRSSYPASTWQRDSAVGWENMLADHGARQIPFDPLGSGSRSDHAELLQELDKQYWQNINRVRVAGTGDTHYVVAKDDIGNWVVKSYEADPKPIIEGARALALRAASADLGTDVLSLADAQRAGADLPTPPSASAKQFKKITERHLLQSKEDLDALRRDAGSLRERIEAAWSSNTAIAGKIPTAAAKEAARGAETELLTPVSVRQASGTDGVAELGGKILDGLEGLRQYDARVRARIQDLAIPAPSEANAQRVEGERDAANAALTEREAAVVAAQKLYDAAKANVDAVVPPNEPTQQQQDDLADAKKALTAATAARDTAKTTAQQRVAAATAARAAADIAKNGVTALLRELRSLARADLDKHIGSRRRALQNYRTGVTIIGESIED